MRKVTPRAVHNGSCWNSIHDEYALDAIENPALKRPTRVVLISPMIGVTRFARFAGLAGLPAVLPAFERAAWLSIVPEFNPFKYNSFPVNGARQSYLLTDVIQQQIKRLERENRLDMLPPTLTFFPYLLQRIDEGIGKMPPPVAKSPRRSHETAAGQPDDFADDMNELEQIGSDEP
jgi:hypothetical protein